MLARYYNANIGRFISQDLANIDNPRQFLKDPQQLNFYSYTRNNPIRYIDPNGKTATEAVNGYFTGLGEGFRDTVKSVANSISHPIDAVKNVGDSITKAGDEWKQFTSDIKSDPKGVISQIGDGIQIGYNEFMDETSDYEKGEAIGKTTEKVMEVVTVSKVTEGLAGNNLKQTVLGADKGVQFGKYNISIDKYPNAGGGGINLRNTNLPNNQRIFGIDYHKFKYDNIEKPRLHYHSGSGQDSKIHKPWGNK